MRPAPARAWDVTSFWRSRTSIIKACKMGEPRRARTCALRPPVQGFVDTSMYLAALVGSKNAACIWPDKLRRIFRKLRLADLQQSCRLPIGERRSVKRPNSHFAIRNVSHGKWNAGASASGMPLKTALPQADSGPFFMHAPGAGDLSGQIVWIASDPPDWTCVL